MTLTKRISVFVAFWLLAGVCYAIFSDISVEPGENELLARLQLVYLAPLFAALGIAFTLVHSHGETWPQREHYEVAVGWLLIAFFVAHAVITLTRRTKRQFIALSVIQVLFLVASVFCVLHFFHYEATHGHG